MEFLLNEPELAADACVIWMHGLGADASDFAGIVGQLGLPVDHRVRFLFPQAPFRPITVNQGMVMRGWYDIFSFDRLLEEDTVGVEGSFATIGHLIQQQMEQGIVSERIILAGFSQGGAIALYTGLRSDMRLGGVIVLSAYLPLANALDAERYMVNREIPIFMAHGMFDPIVPFAIGRATYERLIIDGYDVEWNSYPMVHTVLPEEIDDIGAFIRRCLGYV